MLPEAERRRGVWTISAGNAGQGVAYAARQAGVPCTVVAIETAPVAKLERMRALGATLIPVPYHVAWKALEDRAYEGADGTFVHPFDDHNFIAGHATMGLEILEDAPDAAAVIAGIGGGGLITGVASAVKALKPSIKVWGSEPETAAPAARSFAMGSPQPFPEWTASFVDGAGGQSLFPRMFERMQPRGRRLHRREPRRDEARDAPAGREGARDLGGRRRALAVAAALTGKAGQGPIVAVVSGGNIDLRSSELVRSPQPLARSRRRHFPVSEPKVASGGYLQRDREPNRSWKAREWSTFQRQGWRGKCKGSSRSPSAV